MTEIDQPRRALLVRTEPRGVDEPGDHGGAEIPADRPRRQRAPDVAPEVEEVVARGAMRVRVGIGPDTGLWQLAFVGRNLTNKQYIQFGGDTPLSGTTFGVNSEIGVRREIPRAPQVGGSVTGGGSRSTSPG